MSGSTVHRLWFDDAMPARVARGLLAPAGWAYAGVAAARNAMYDRGWLASEPPALPTISLGNLSVGGTGKTPVAAWVAGRLLDAGARPAIVLRGYGADEPLVHQRLNPAAVVVVDADRRRGVRHARDLGADCAILDDAFQHRRIRRNADWLLVSAEQWRSDLRCLPAGPLRESTAALARATLIVITRKAATPATADGVAEWLRREHGVSEPAIVHLALDQLVDARSSASVSLSWLRGRSVVAVAAVGMPSLFFAQLRSAGAAVEAMPYGDHHAFEARDVARIVGCATATDGVICTLKDAVKLAPLWPREGPVLWYVSQRAVVERGAAALDASLAEVLTARASVTQTAGPAGPSSQAHGHRSSTADQ